MVFQRYWQVLSCLIDFIDDSNNKEMIYHENSTLHLSNKAYIICNALHEFIHNDAR